MATIVISLLPDGAIPVDEYEETEEGSSCPLPTQDEDLNAENKQVAIDEADYRDPNTGSSFLMDQVCGNCAAFNQTDDILECLGLDDDMDRAADWLLPDLQVCLLGRKHLRLMGRGRPDGFRDAGKVQGQLLMDVVDFARVVYKRLREREQDIADALASGTAKDWEQYQSLVGEIRGLTYAREEFRALLEQNADDVEDIISS
jgi:hypothetical protein